MCLLLTKVKLLYEQQELISMSTFDNVKESLTNKIDELREELNSDNNAETEDPSQEKDLQEVPDDHTEIVDEIENDDLITEEPAEDRLATDYDLVQNDLDQNQDSGLDDFRDEDTPDEIVNDSNGNLVVDSDVVEVSEYDSDGDLVSEERIETGTVYPSDEEERRIAEIDDLYQSPDPEETP